MWSRPDDDPEYRLAASVTGFNSSYAKLRVHDIARVTRAVGPAATGSGRSRPELRGQGRAARAAAARASADRRPRPS